MIVELSTNRNDLIRDLEEIIANGEQVSVFTGQIVRNTFDPHISLSGKLEQHPEEREKFRIVINRGSYCYFDILNVEEACRDRERAFIDGSSIVIRLNFDSMKALTTLN